MTRSKDVPSGKCTVCQHPERTRIELFLTEGVTMNSVARKYAVTRHALRRHWDNHLSPERKATLALGSAPDREALTSRIADENSGVIDHFRAVRAGLTRLFNAALDATDGTTGAMVGGRLIECLNSMGKLTGELANSPLVQINQQNNYLSDPGFARFQAMLIETLRPYEEARNAVISLFETIDDEAPEQPPRRRVTYDAAA